MRVIKDRDFLKTLEGFLFCVVGYAHPRNRVISYLKYVPSSEGAWGRENKRYSRTMPNYTVPSLLNNIEMLRKNHPKYVFYSRIFNICMSAVPRNRIAEHYLPEVKLQTLFSMNELGPLQDTAIELVSFLSRKANISKDDFGITGSILTDIHNQRFSDIDLTVYGRANAWRVKKMLEETSNNNLLNRTPDKRKKMERWVKNYPLTIGEAEIIYDRRWNYSTFKERPFSIHAVRKDEEIVERYGDKRFFPRGIVEGRAEVTGIDESLFLPCTYGVKGLEVKLGSGIEEVCEVVSYDGLYSGLFECGEQILVKGKLEVVTAKNGSDYLRVLIGSPQAKGRDYIKPYVA